MEKNAIPKGVKMVALQTVYGVVFEVHTPWTKPEQFTNPIWAEEDMHQKVAKWRGGGYGSEA